MRRGILPLREAIAGFHKRTMRRRRSTLERITVPGAAMLASSCALQCVVETGDNIVIVSPIWPNIFQAAKIAGAEPRLVRLDEDWNSRHAGGSIWRNCSTPATRAPRRSSSPRPAIPPAG